jgi:glycosyltransferase involved in cell wall biosynthesis
MQVIHIITGLQRGGAETLLSNLCKFDTQHIHTIISLSELKDSESVLNDQPNVCVYSLNFPNGKLRLSGLFKLYKLIKQIKPDMVQTWMIHADMIGGIVARLAGVKNIFWSVHYTNLVKGRSKKSTILLTKINAFLSYFIPKKIIYCAEKSREVQESLGFKKTKGVVVQNGYDVESFIENTSLGLKFRNELGIHPEAFVIGHVGSYDPLKDQETLIKSLGYLDQKGINFNAIFVGKKLDSSNDNLIKLIKDNGLTKRIHLLGIRNDISAIMNGIDVFMLSSVSEAFPNVLNEAMACETPCITTDVGDAAIIVGDTGWIVSPQDAKALAKSSIKALEEKKLYHESWKQRKKACRERIIENFSFEKMIKKYKEVWSA